MIEKLTQLILTSPSGIMSQNWAKLCRHFNIVLFRHCDSYQLSCLMIESETTLISRGDYFVEISFCRGFWFKYLSSCLYILSVHEK